MEPISVGPLRVRSIGGADRRGGGDGPAVVLCHGYGAPGDDLHHLARVVDAGREARWFFPEAPLELPDFGWGVRGRAWWPIDLARLERMARGLAPASFVNDTPPGLAEARAALEGFLDALERDHGVQRDRLVLGGFSQGAMLTAEVALHADRPFAGLALLSGALLSADRWRAAAARSGASIRALQAHGRADSVLPFAAGEALRDLLAASGAALEWVTHGGGHEIPQAVVDRLGAFLRGRLSTER
jgi:phospholipase/carboxylesterase